MQRHDCIIYQRSCICNEKFYPIFVLPSVGVILRARDKFINYGNKCWTLLDRTYSQDIILC